MAIRSFKCRDTAALFSGKRVRKFVQFETIAIRKLAMLNRASILDDLKIPLGNRLEALKGDRVGQFSIRINDRYRICFIWASAGVEDVEIVDYH
jgi:toxin HigB-1